MVELLAGIILFFFGLGILGRFIDAAGCALSDGKKDLSTAELCKKRASLNLECDK